MKKAQGRILCWDDSVIDKNDGVQILMHRPERKNVALRCDDQWEGPHCGYGRILKVGDVYRLYYRASDYIQRLDGEPAINHAVICVAESRDGINFTKPNIEKIEFNGSTSNNIIFERKDVLIDNFSVFYDDNPECPEDQRFKALSEYNPDGRPQLLYYASADGYDFRLMYALDVKGSFDSYNAMVWDKDTEQYFLFYRAYHTAEGEDRFFWEVEPKIDIVNDIRDIRVATSKDFKNWTEHGRIKFSGGKKEYPLYINNISKYYRAASTFVGFPLRYSDRAAGKRNFDHMPQGYRHRKVTEAFGREGTAITDNIFMTSRDGFTFDRRDEAFITQGPEHRNNWWYAGCSMAYGLIETKSDYPDASDEISFFLTENYRIKDIEFRRYTVRLDGFFSWFGGYDGATVLTKPLTVEGDSLKVNFATSSAGGMTVALCDEDGKELEGYNSYIMFGDSTDRPVEFDRPLSDIKGKTVRLKIRLSDAHLYSFIFE